MVYVHKVSAEPINAYEMIRSGGPNVLVPRAKGKYLLLWNVEMSYRDGIWHYVFTFDTRDSLEISPLAQAVLGKEKGETYPSKVDWTRWLGEDWEVISPLKRELLLGSSAPQRQSAVVVEQLKLDQSPRMQWDAAKLEAELARAKARKVVSHAVPSYREESVVVDPEGEFVLAGAE